MGQCSYEEMLVQKMVELACCSPTELDAAKCQFGDVRKT